MLNPSRLFLATILLIPLMATVGQAKEQESRVPMLTNKEAWDRLPAATEGAGQPLPSWARILVTELPRSTAAWLQLDAAHRTKSPIEPGLRAGMRWIAAHANRCAYAEAYAIADARRVGVTEDKLTGLAKEGYAGWTEGEQAALRFARKMTLDSDDVTDEEFAALVKHFGERQAASMVLLMAQANMQDRFLLSTKAPLEEGGPLPPLDIKFGADAFVFKTIPPNPPKKTPLPAPTGKDLVEEDDDWGTTFSYEALQTRLEEQRKKPTRLHIPSWDEVSQNVPAGMFKKPSEIIWYRIVFGYAPELAVPFEVFMRTAGAEASAKWDRIFAQSLFWITTRAVKCPYCMGHCEMNWEVAGLTLPEIAERSKLLAGNDWSSFTPAEQHAFAYARKLARTPWAITDADAAELKKDFGPDRALIVMLNSSRHHYMVRISNGFQLTLERENVFYDYYNTKPPTAAAPAVSLLSDKEVWEKMPAAEKGTGQPLPHWARAVARSLPKTAAAMLQLDLAHRTQSPLDPVLRAKMRWVIAHANRCDYSERYALADLKRAGADDRTVSMLTGAPAMWPEADQEPLEFARLLTLAAPTIPDALFASLRKKFGDKKVASMVLLAAYGNFQDRIVLGFNLPVEENGPLAPVAVTFPESAFQIAPIYPAQSQLSALNDGGQTVVEEDSEWAKTSYDELQVRLERQRDRAPRLPIPSWDDVKKVIPPAMATRPTRIVWNLVCSGYVPELAVPWSIATRTMWSETKPDRIFEESLFWIQTRAIGCNYCMGHCEMLLEVAGLDKPAIAERTKKLAGSDWSAFPPAEQRAYAYARKLSQTPWNLTVADYQTLESDLGPDQGMATFWWLCRGLYMTRVSDGFQLPLERDNVFQQPAQAAQQK